MKNKFWLIPLLLSVGMAQTGDPEIGWLTRLQTVQATLRRLPDTAAAEVRRAEGDLRQLRREIETHPEMAAMKLPEPAGGGDGEALLEEASAMRSAIEERQRQKPGTAFCLARIEVNVTESVEQLPTAVTIDESEYRRRDLGTIPDALALTPGLSIQRVGPRNERGVFVRGFDMRQAPLYIDGIPAYVPYDGCVDMDRFLTYDVGEVQVAKGFSSPLYRPYALGGRLT